MYKDLTTIIIEDYTTHKHTNNICRFTHTRTHAHTRTHTHTVLTLIFTFFPIVLFNYTGSY